MIWKILNKMYGWDYIHWKNFRDEGISRIRIDAEGKPYFWRYQTTRVLDRLNVGNKITWLTCKPEKYGIE